MNNLGRENKNDTIVFALGYCQAAGDGGNGGTKRNMGNGGTGGTGGRLTGICGSGGNVVGLIRHGDGGNSAAMRMKTFRVNNSPLQNETEE